MNNVPRRPGWIWILIGSMAVSRAFRLGVQQTADPAQTTLLVGMVLLILIAVGWFFYERSHYHKMDVRHLIKPVVAVVLILALSLVGNPLLLLIAVLTLCSFFVWRYAAQRSS